MVAVTPHMCNIADKWLPRDADGKNLLDSVWRYMLTNEDPPVASHSEDLEDFPYPCEIDPEVNHSQALQHAMCHHHHLHHHRQGLQSAAVELGLSCLCFTS
eukprot:COSAG06_NODE_3535_length_5218_cov_3.243798_2_plen_101_part_00